MNAVGAAYFMQARTTSKLGKITRMNTTDYRMVTWSNCLVPATSPRNWVARRFEFNPITKVIGHEEALH